MGAWVPVSPRATWATAGARERARRYRFARPCAAAYEICGDYTRDQSDTDAVLTLRTLPPVSFYLFCEVCVSSCRSCRATRGSGWSRPLQKSVADTRLFCALGAQALVPFPCLVWLDECHAWRFELSPRCLPP